MKFISAVFKKLLIALFCFFPSAFSQKNHIISVEYNINKLPFGLTEKVPALKPTIALALSGGGARGFAQIGVLKAFEEENIPIDIIVGTSMGSIIGGLYSVGYSIDEIDSIAVNTDWNSLLAFDRETNRRELFIDQKITEDKAILTLRLKGLTPLLPTSINSGQKLSNFFNLLTLQAPIHVNSSFDDLKTKFRAVSTDLVTGSPVIISDGSLSQAIRASSSVSFFLPPVRMDSLILVDGGLVANIPVGIASQLGDFVIAVNTTSSLHPEEELGLPWVVADQIVSIPMKILNQAQLENADVIINPQLEKNNSNNFTNIDSVIQNGYETALPYAKIIKGKIDSLFRENIKNDEVYFKNLKVEKNVPENIIFQKYSLRDSVSNYDILNDLYFLLETGDYKDLKAKIIDYGSSSSLRLIIEKNPEVKEVHLNGISIIDKNKADSIASALKENPFNTKTLLSKSIEIIRIYREQGYSLAELEEINFNEITGVLDLHFDEGMIAEVSIEGNYYTNQTIITREFPVEAGQYFYYDDVERGLTNLRSTNLFDDIVLTVEKKNDKNIVVLTVLEKVSSLMRIGFRIDNENKAQFSIDLRDENLFGSGTELGLLLFGGARNRAYILEHKSNRIFDTYFTYKINAFYQFDDAFIYRNDPSTSDRRFSRSIAGEYRQVYYGGSVSIGTQVERFGNLIFTGKYQFDEILNKQSGIIDPYKIKIVSLKISSTIDTQDKYPYPQYGFYFNGSYETAQRRLGGDVGFTNIGFDYKYFITFENSHTISPRLTMGFADKTLPLSQQYSLGGQNSFFGMRDDEFKGRQIFLASLEYRYKLPFSIFFDTYFKFRYDLGSIWDVQDQIRFKDLKHGLGITFSFDTPVGPADFSVGRSFLFKSNIPGSPISLGDVYFYFSIGYYY